MVLASAGHQAMSLILPLMPEMVPTGFTVPSFPARSQQLYEITLEPEGGSPTGRPTGPVLMKGLATTPL